MEAEYALINNELIGRTRNNSNNNARKKGNLTHPHPNFVICELFLARDNCRLRINHVDLEKVGWNAVHVV